MLDLPKLLDKDLLERIYPFLERDHDEYMQILEDNEVGDAKSPAKLRKLLERQFVWYRTKRLKEPKV